MSERERDLTWDERSKWGRCPVCGAGDRIPCVAEVGVHLGRKADGGWLKTGEGVHLARLSAAPVRVREVPCR
jgi:hypothetical protein